MINAASAFREATKARQQDPDGGEKLLCTEPGCGRRWTVKVDKPLCSFHAWGPRREEYVSLASYASSTDGADGRRWARRILRAQEDGVNVRPLSLKMAQAALRGRG